MNKKILLVAMGLLAIFTSKPLKIMKPILLLIFGFFIIVLKPVYAIENQISLNGFYLHQYKTVALSTLGKPFRQIERKDSKVEAFLVSQKGYMVFVYLDSTPHNIFSIQITGEAPKMIPFVGLILGDDEEKVRKILGKPDSKTPIPQPKVNRWNYDKKNFSIEIDENGKLYSIKIKRYPYLLKKTKPNSDPWEDFKKTILKKNIKGLAKFLHPEMEIYKENKTLTIDKSFHTFFKKPSTSFLNAMFAKENSVYKELQLTKAEEEIRILEKNVGLVYKFYEGKILQEIFFLPYANEYRIYEIKFRK